MCYHRTIGSNRSTKTEVEVLNRPNNTFLGSARGMITCCALDSPAQVGHQEEIQAQVDEVLHDARQQRRPAKCSRV